MSVKPLSRVLCGGSIADPPRCGNTQEHGAHWFQPTGSSALRQELQQHRVRVEGGMQVLIDAIVDRVDGNGPDLGDLNRLKAMLDAAWAGFQGDVIAQINSERQMDVVAQDLAAGKGWPDKDR